MAARGRADRLGRGDGALEGPRPDEPRVREPLAAGVFLGQGGRVTTVMISRAEATREAAAAGPLSPAQTVEARLWTALGDVEDPEIAISVVGMGLIVSIAYGEEDRAVD